MIAFGAFFALLSAFKALSTATNTGTGTGAGTASNSSSLRYPLLQQIMIYLPSGIAFAVGFLNSPSFSLTRLIGGYIAYRSARYASRSALKVGSGIETRENEEVQHETPLLAIVVASGFVLGEGVFSVVTLALTSAGYGAVSCWGCGVGGGGYCSGGCT